jgi:hypothetical protein
VPTASWSRTSGVLVRGDQRDVDQWRASLDGGSYGFLEARLARVVTAVGEQHDRPLPLAVGEQLGTEHDGVVERRVTACLEVCDRRAEGVDLVGRLDRHLGRVAERHEPDLDPLRDDCLDQTDRRVAGRCDRLASRGAGDVEQDDDGARWRFLLLDA